MTMMIFMWTGLQTTTSQERFRQCDAKQGRPKRTRDIGACVGELTCSTATAVYDCHQGQPSLSAFYMSRRRPRKLSLAEAIDAIVFVRCEFSCMSSLFSGHLSRLGFSVNYPVHLLAFA